ncbi:STAS domain-containing protein [Telmatospirillum sp. J64-1]|uniref:STAS domain-containing protein n=1 Tax=Telmatospirillum sp. J64-1 TaxID=2502183 RepID=UPI00163DA61D|nr:STAS domain-containing protein [Telmatospirillum sp. J64-1]
MQSIELSGRRTIDEADRTRAELLEALSLAEEELVVDCSGLTEADLSLVQVLMAACRTAAASGRRIIIPPPAADSPLEAVFAAAAVAPLWAPRREGDGGDA